MRKGMRRFKFIYLILLLPILVGCNNGAPKQIQEYDSIPSLANDSSYKAGDEKPSQQTAGEKPKQQTGSKSLKPHSDSYEEGYQDGEAAAEEDRLIGKPGMQSGDEDYEDDEDYEEGYDDGYE